MHEIGRWLAAAALFTLFASGGNPAEAANGDTNDASAYILQAEMALQRQDYRKAAVEYRKAAELTESADVARQATILSMTYGFDREALVSAKRWHKLAREFSYRRHQIGAPSPYIFA